MKNLLRREIASRLKEIPLERIHRDSASIAERLRSLELIPPPHQGGGGGSGVSVYLAMEREVQTWPCLQLLLEHQPGRPDGAVRVYVPKVVGPDSPDMRMLRVNSLEDIRSFPLNHWRIPEPPLEDIGLREDGVVAGIDIVLVPGVAFDRNCGRLGHGRGYYDCFFDAVAEANAARGARMAVTVGLAFDEQLVDSVPMDEHDRRLDYVLTPQETIVAPPRER